MSGIPTRRMGSGRKVFAFAVTWGVAAAILATPAIARACAVCTAGREEENQLSYLLTTLFMSVLPLAAVGTLGFFLWRRFKKLEAELEAKGEVNRRGGGLVAPSATATSGEQRI